MGAERKNGCSLASHPTGPATATPPSYAATNPNQIVTKYLFIASSAPIYHTPPPFSSALLSPPSRRKCLTSCYYHGIIPPHRDLRRMERWLSWSKALDSKSSVAEMSPWVRIPLSPLKGEVPQGASPFVFNTFCSFELHTGSMSPFLQLGRIYPTSSSFALCFITI